MDKIIDEKISKALMSNVQVNDQSKISTSALAYAMQQSIKKMDKILLNYIILSSNISQFQLVIDKKQVGTVFIM